MLTLGSAKFCSVEDLNNFVKENKIRKKLWTSIQVTLICSKCGKEEKISISNFRRKFNDSAILCNSCHRASLTTEKCYHHWTEEEKLKAKAAREKTCQKRYGVSFTGQLDSVRNAVTAAAQKRTQEEKDISSQKRKNTCLKRYNATSPMQCFLIKEKAKQTSLEKYGTENPAASDQVKEKINLTFEKKYGGSPLNTLKVREKIKSTMFERYGTVYNSQNEKISAKIKDSLLDYGEAAFLVKCEENNLEPIDLDYIGTYDGKPIYYKCKCLNCGNIVEIAPHNHNFKCVHCYGKNAISSFGEKELLDFVKSIYTGPIIENDRRTISPLELDILLPEKKLAIEFNGDYWHNEFNKSKMYHKEKTIKCAEKGIHLVHIFEYQWETCKETVKSIIKSFLVNDSERIYARKCTVKEIPTNVAKDFCVENHMQGYSNASVCLGLYYENKLVQVETFGRPRFSSNYDWELVRECSKKDVSIVGGKSKLFRYFQENYNPKSIVSYCDAALFSGDSYLKCGMTLKQWNDPGYVWCKQHTALSRYKCQKHKLLKLHPECVNMTEPEIMHSLGFAKLYDCGQKVFIWTKKSGSQQ